MTLDLGNVDANTVLYIPFHTFNSSGASVTISGLAVTDIEIYKNGSTTTRASDNGYTLLDTDGIDFASKTGIHGFSIDLSDNSDAGFYAAGSFYWVVVSAITVDSQTVSFVAATFRIGPAAANVTQLLGTAWATPATAGLTDVNVKQISTDATAADNAELFFDGTGYAGGTTKLGVDIVSISGDTTSADNLESYTDGTTPAPVNVTQLSGDATAADNSEAFFDGTGYAGTNNVIPLVTTTTTATNVTTVNGLAANVITAASMAADASAEIADAVWDEDATGHQTQGTFGQAIGDPIADANTIFKATVTDATGATVGVDSAAIITTLGVAGAGLTDLGGMSTTMKAQVEAEVDDALGSGTGAALTAIPWNAAWDTEVQSEVDDALVAQRLDELLNADSDIDGAAPPTVGSVFHELMTKTAGSFTYDQTTDSNEALRDRGDAAWVTATGFSTHSAADVWASGTRTLTAATNITSTGGTTVPQTGDSYARLGAPAGASVSADIAAIEAQTDDIGVAGAGLTDLGGMSTTMKAQVNAEVVDTLATDTYAEPGQGAPSATTSLAAKINYLFKAWRNKKTQTSTTRSLYADDGTTVDQKATDSDDSTTFTKGEIVSGP